jgi:uncharacterized membrane protein YeiH
VAGVKYKLDILGVLVLSFVAANAGGIARRYAACGAADVLLLSVY